MVRKRPTIAPGEVDHGLQRLYQKYLRAMHVLFKSAFVYETNNQALVAAAERVATAANQIRMNVSTTASLELMADGAYVNRTLLKLDPGAFEQADYLHTICHTLGIAAITAIEDTDAGDWLALITAFKRCIGPGGNFAEFVRVELGPIKLTPALSSGRADNLAVMGDRFRVLRAYATTVIAIGDVLEAARAGHALRALRIKRPLQDLISLAPDSAALLLALAHLKRHKLRPEHHLANTAVLVICAVRALDLPRTTTSSLALSAALHDLGRAIEPDGEAAPGPASERRFAHRTVAELVALPLSGAPMLDRVVVAHEVRRWIDRASEPAGEPDYPFELATATRVIAIAHAYSLLTTPRADRPGLLPDEALRVIMRDAGRRYDVAAVRLFVNALGVYPIGSTIALSDGRAAVVIEAPHDAGGGAAPRVKIVRDAGGAIVDGAIVDLATTAGVTAVRCIDAEAYDINAPAFLLS